ncbi:carbohydrate ABC transporter permease [Poseidonocella sp. HB161398]|uniref:carbohydrate ABC transporter permease n=1 Tax=Poseidonocella sp. HB161398 TaxID=2320855 RepID=UPI0011084F65|nr:sugar ABC transporter permease [Poseidonocella sp. HB161398]
MKTSPRNGPPRFRHWPAALALSPVWAIALLLFVGTAGYTVYLSFTASRMMPVNEFVGFEHYIKLFGTRRWNTSLANMGILCVTYVLGCLVLGFLLAAALDRKVRFENTLRTIFLYPQAVSFVVTGLVWQWLMNPGLGIQAAVQGWGWESFTFDWTQHRGTAIYAVAIAGLWQGAGLTMILLLAGLRGIDHSLWQAARVEGIPLWRTYVSVILPELTPAIATAATLLFMGIVRTYDLIVAMTNGGPGSATELPAKFIMDNLFDRMNIGAATAGASVMLISVMAVIVPVLYIRALRKGGRKPV